MELVDAYRSGSRIALWLKTPEGEVRVEKTFSATLHVEDTPDVRSLLRREGVGFEPLVRRDCLFAERRVLRITLAPDEFERFVSWFERATLHRVPIYDADVKPELQFLWSSGLTPLCAVDDSLRLLDREPPIALSVMELEIGREGDQLRRIVMDGHVLAGDERRDGKNENRGEKKENRNGKNAKADEKKTNEKEILEEFARRFIRTDPDVIVVEHGFQLVPFLAQRLAFYGIACPLHRWDPAPICYRGGRSFFTYGQIQYRDYAVRLNGRFLLDTRSTLGGCSVDALVELCQLSGGRLQQIASRSPGAAFQTALLRELFLEGLLIPYKQLPLNEPVSMTEMLKSDRAGHTMDPQLGFHRNVAELDFSSMFPWLMYNHNISAEQLVSSRGPFVYAPGLPIRISMARKGFVPRAIKPFLDRRMRHKRELTSVNREKAAALKAVLVSANGYLRFREFKLGMARSHMALCAFARETMLCAKELAEEKGFTVVHGIVDSLYVKKPGMTEEEVLALCTELEMQSGIPISFEGIFSWVVFLPSVADVYRPVPARYYGTYLDGTVKARGIEVRQRSAPLVVREFQNECLRVMSECGSRREILSVVASLGRLLREVVGRIPTLSAEALACRVRLGHESYSRDVPQRAVLAALRRRGISPVPGQTIRFVHTVRGAVLPEEYAGDADTVVYRKLLVRALYVLLEPFGFSLSDVQELAGEVRQTRIAEYTGGSAGLQRAAA